MLVAALASAALTATLFGVRATAVTPAPSYAIATGSAAGSGTLALAVTARGAGFEQRVAGMLPGDVVNRYVDVTSTGSVSGRRLALAVAATPRGVLTSDGVRTRALRVSVTLCTQGRWTPTTGRCDGREVVLLRPVPLDEAAGGRDLRLEGLAAGTAVALRLTLQLPDQDDVVINGLPSRDSVQGRSTNLTWVFRTAQ